MEAEIRGGAWGQHCRRTWQRRCSAQSRKTEQRRTKGPPPIVIYPLTTLKHLTSSSSSLPFLFSAASHKYRRDKALLAFPGKLLPAPPFLPKLDENKEFRSRPPKSPPPPSLNGLWSPPPLSLRRWRQYKAISGWPTFLTIYVGQGQDRLKCSEIARGRRRVEERGRQSIPAATQIYPPTPTLDCPSCWRRLFLLPVIALKIPLYRLVGNCWPLFSPGPIERLLSINLGRWAGMWMAVLEGNRAEGVGFGGPWGWGRWRFRCRKWRQALLTLSHCHCRGEWWPEISGSSLSCVFEAGIPDRLVDIYRRC